MYEVNKEYTDAFTQYPACGDQEFWITLRWQGYLACVMHQTWNLPDHKVESTLEIHKHANDGLKSESMAAE